MAIRQRDSKRARRGFIGAAVLCLTSGVASAQMPPPGGLPPPRAERPYRGLFGESTGKNGHSLTIEEKLGGGLVENPAVEQGAAPISDPSATAGGSAMVSTTLNYSVDRTRWGASAQYLSLVDYYVGHDQLSLWNRHFVSGTVYFMPTPATRVSFSPAYKNVPEFNVSDLFDPIDQGLPFIQDFSFSLVRYHRYGAGLEVNHTLSKRSRVTFEWHYGHGKVEAQAKEWVIMDGSGTFTHSIAKGLALFVGYQEGGQRDVINGVKTSIERQPRIKGGVDMNRALSISRRTMLSF